jgi:hypothetical protein
MSAFGVVWARPMTDTISFGVARRITSAPSAATVHRTPGDLRLDTVLDLLFAFGESQGTLAMPISRANGLDI